MILNFDNILKMEDTLDEFLYGKNLTEQELVDRNLASTVEVAQTFQKTYDENPAKGLLVLICDRYCPTAVTLDYEKIALPSDCLQSKVEALWTMSQVKSNRMEKYIVNHKYCKRHKEEQA